MRDSRNSVKKIGFAVGKVALVIVVVLGAIVACVSYLNWSAERKATKFCDEIEIGSDISVAIRKAKDKKDYYGDSQQYTFYYWGMVFDKAICEVSIEERQRPVSSSTTFPLTQAPAPNWAAWE
jgi:hypothetical protein